MKKNIYTLVVLLFLVALPIQSQEHIVIENETITGTRTVEAGTSIVIKPTTQITLGTNFLARIIGNPYKTLSLSTNENYVFTRDFQVATTTGVVSSENDVIENIVYFDGLGRAKQSVGIKQSKSQNDIVTYMAYDALGRQVKEYLPYASNTATGAIKTDALTATNNYYKTHYAADIDANAPNPFSEKVVENSPLARVFEQTAPGKDWAKGSTYASKGYSNDSHSIKFEYDVNVANEVKLFKVTTSFANNTYTPSLTGGSFYNVGTLYKTITKDENWELADGVNHTTEEFKNKQGQVILKRTYNAGQKHDTYYVYDDFGNLTYVLPPKMEASTASVNTIISKLNDLGYQYKYDYRNRLVEKKIPGKGWEYIVYDKLDRPIATQDAIQHESAQKYWLFTKYDKLGRVVYTGEMNNNQERVATQASTSAYFQYENRVGTANSYAGTSIFYTKQSFPSSFDKIYTINYYDTYVDLPSGLNPTVTNSYGVTSTANTAGLATVTKTRVLGTGSWITTVTYYDDKARPIYVYSKNDALDTEDIMESKLDFVGKVIETKSTHKKHGKADIVIIDSFTYDHVGRLVAQNQKINNQATEAIVANTYDELGQLESKKLGGNLQTVDYSYNIRGWLKNINQDTKNDNDLFNFSLKYNDPTTGTALYNGNISQTSWNTLNTDTSSKTYTYSYDALNRITAAKGVLGDKYDVSGISYDKNGNILTLKRNGHLNTSASSFGVMDDLVYSYHDNSNVLRRVADNSNKAYGFKDGAGSYAEYTYDENGNMKTDANKGITNITYNHLNLPTQVIIGGQQINYVYDAAGTKLKKIVGSTTTEYAGNYIYENGDLQFFNHAEGYVKVDNVTSSAVEMSYVYQYKDHLGNVRLSFAKNKTSGATEIIEESNYYPFGLKHKGYNGNYNPIGNAKAQKWGYGGKELQEELGLNWYDVTARNYDPSIGRWMNLDPLAEQMRRHSPYNFAFDNPIYFMDYDGMAPTDPNDPSVNDKSTSTSGAVNYSKTVNYPGRGTPYSPTINTKNFFGTSWSHNHTYLTENSSSFGTRITNFSTTGSSFGKTRASIIEMRTGTDLRAESNSVSRMVENISGQFYDADGNAVASSEGASSLVVTNKSTTESVDFKGTLTLGEEVTETTTTTVTSYDLMTNKSGRTELVNKKANSTTTMKTINFDNASKGFKKYAQKRLIDNYINRTQMEEKAKGDFQNFVKDLEEISK